MAEGRSIPIISTPTMYEVTTDDLRILVERAVRRQCTGVLQGRCVGQIAIVEPRQGHGCHHDGHEALPADAMLRILDRTFAREGVAIELLAAHGCGQIFYVYRPDLLMDALGDARITKILRGLGYDTLTVDACVASLKDRASCEGGTFPCEISFFLGRPYEDRALLRFSGMTNSLCRGPWRALVQPAMQSERDERLARELLRNALMMPVFPRCPGQRAMN